MECVQLKRLRFNFEIELSSLLESRRKKKGRKKQQQKMGGKNLEVLGELNLGLSAWKTTTLTTKP